MRKSKDKVSLYESLKTQHLCLDLSTGLKTSRVKLPKLGNRSPNFFRVGCPTEILIHIPHHVAKLKEESQLNTGRLRGSIKELIEEYPEKKQEKGPKSSNEIWQEFDSIKVPIKSFADLKLPSQYFSLGSIHRKEEDEDLREVMKKISSSDGLKPLSTRAQEIKDRFTIRHDLIIGNNKSPYFTSPHYFT